MVYSEHGDPAQVLTAHEYDMREPADDEFLVRFLAAPINPADINQIEGVYPKRPSFSDKFGTALPSAVGGNEGLVEVIKAGRGGMSMTWSLGQWAIMRRTTFGTWRTHALVKADDLLPVPVPDVAGLDPVQVATVSVNPCTAYRMLRDFYPLRPGGWFVQNGANSAVGKSAVQMGRIWGLRSINIIRQRPGHEQVRDELYALGADIVLTDAELEDRAALKTLLRDQVDGPVKLALNCVGGSATMNLCRLLADGAHVVTYGAMAKQPLKVAASLLIFRDLHFHGFWVSPWNDAHPQERLDMLKQIFAWMKDGSFKSPEANVNHWGTGQTLAEFEEVFKKALADKSQKQVMAMHF
ncbi:putative Mitochondrial enoyl reductase [Taphrina deformans PYCC 5710]|uniref:enoyl-[acyl-carrier-protein] reductase n=1 Tax=Taphrina deformans (strain PYCC 5710 / ATCC 11124 / CBS 356.35 / IMI 108563 / JCM 9778 / NBRC 8474) TaxID=1097556 RepID=R4X8N8_TAPDE|nr:putative Mitochondrial enoyl reductase [Taphrina deformans PYCC 5710]|eukprot:CCG81745.1 putative Mitochondrial enoyl reductase [Taphrina deformans PYCC 5710]